MNRARGKIGENDVMASAMQLLQIPAGAGAHLHDGAHVQLCNRRQYRIVRSEDPGLLPDFIPMP